MKAFSLCFLGLLLFLSFKANGQFTQKAASAEEARMMENCCAMKNKNKEGSSVIYLTPYQPIDFKKKRILLHVASNADRSLKHEFSFQQRPGKWFGLTYNREGDWDKYLFR